MTRTIVFDSGGLIAIERNDRRILALIKAARDTGATILIPAVAVAEAGARVVRKRISLDLSNRPTPFQRSISNLQSVRANLLRAFQHEYSRSMLVLPMWPGVTDLRCSSPPIQMTCVRCFTMFRQRASTYTSSSLRAAKRDVEVVPIKSRGMTRSLVAWFRGH